MANATNRVLAVLALSARHGAVLLALGIFAGLALPPLAHALHPEIAPNVIGMMTLVLIRTDLAASRAHLRRPLRLGAIVLAQLLAAPLAAAAVARACGLGPGIAGGVVMFATGPSAMSGAAFARLVGLDPDLTLLATLAETLFVPFTAPPLVHALTGAHLAIGVAGLMARLVAAVGVPMALALIVRRALGRERLRRVGPAIDGATVWMLVLYGIAVMDGLAGRAATDPAWVAEAALAAFVAALGLNLLTALAFAGFGRVPAASAGLMSGNRNMALYLAVLPAGADPRLALFFALCQFPLYLSPFLLRPVYRRLLAPRLQEAGPA